MSRASKIALEEGRHAVQTATPLTMPKTLTKPAQAVWKEMVGAQVTGTYSETDRHQLAVYCEAVVTFQMTTAALARDGFISTGSMGQPTVSPLVAIRDKAAAQIDKVGPSLFLTPTSRQSMKSDASSKPTFGSLTGGLIQ